MSDPIPPATYPRRRALPVLLLILGLTIVFTAAVVMTLVLVFQPADTPTPATAPTKQTTTPPAQPIDFDNDHYEPEDRLPAGTAVPLSINQKTRDQLAAIAVNEATDGSGAPNKAGKVTNSGVIYLGMIYGQTPDEDEFHVVALLDAQYYWTTRGKKPWKYQGVFDARLCGPPVPGKLIQAWGAQSLFGPTAPPGTDPCAR
ncbi:hypothetical protein HII36_20900 [Nonomuraea sp. NN258]|uniref:hypothetical protein n=1 Tax=Nonomuraea antri TaxID=2730852 RepID=UPI001569E918|nr:hypothetical protein [Nonomuraea antri]NRQ34292.1 hypothetical protein [Nonomuraea antri]